MGLRNTARAWLGIEEVKALMPDPTEPTPEVWAEHTVRRVENQVARGRNWNQSKSLAPYATNLALDCAMFNAKNLAGTPLRLYRKAKGGGSVNTRRVGKARMAHLTDAKAVGRKAAMMADIAGEVVEITDSPVLEILRRPDLSTTGMAWDVARWVDKQLYGECLLLKTGDGLIRLAPQFCSVQPHADGVIAGWYYGRESVDQAEYQIDEVLQLKWAEHPSNPYRGLGWLDMAIREIEIDDYALAAELNRWKQGGYPDMVLSFESIKNATQLKEAITQLSAQIRRRLGFIVTGESKLTPLSLPKDMQYAEGLAAVERRILNRAGIPESLYKLNDANLASSSTGHEAYARYTLAPALAVDAEQWTERLLPMFDLDPDVYFFAYDEVSERDETATTTRVVSLVGAGVWSINRALSELGDPPVGPEGDKLRVSGVALDSPGGFGASPSVLAPREKPTALSTATDPNAETVAETALNGAQVTALQGLVTDAAAGLIPVESARSIARAAFPAVPLATLEEIFAPLTGFVPEPPAAAPAPAPVVAPAKAIKIAAWGHPDPYAACGHSHGVKTVDVPGAAPSAIQRLQAAMLDYFGLVSSRVTAEAIASGAIDLSALDAEFAASIEPLIAEVFRAGTENGYAVLGQSVDFFDVAPEEALRVVQERGNLVLDLVRTSTEDGLRDAIAQATEQGLSAKEAEKVIRESLGDAAPHRAEAIARTEGQHAMGTGSNAAWTQAGVAQNRWKLSAGPCPICDAMVNNWGRENGNESKAKPIDTPFVKAGQTVVGTDGTRFTAKYDIFSQPLHPNCQCTTLPVLEELEP